MSYLFTSESVSEGHPDKVADQISDAILDQFIAFDPQSKVACETLVTTGQVIVAGEVKSKAYVDLEKVIREVINNIGYTRSEYKFVGDSCGILTAIHEQSPDINMGVERTRPEDQGAGDQGMMFGYATSESDDLIPLPLFLSHRILMEMAEMRREGDVISYLRPDSKSQVTIEYDDAHRPKRIDTIVISTQHDPFEQDNEVMLSKIRSDIKTILLPRVFDNCSDSIRKLFNNDIKFAINPTGRFVEGGPHADTGLTGRKIIVDTYGGKGAHGGGAFSGKDPSKVDRSAAYAARHIAKNLVKAGVADELLVQLSYAIGVADPVGIYVNTYGTSKVGLSDHEISRKINELFELRPFHIEKNLKLRNPIYFETAAYGHMGRSHSTVKKSFPSNGHNGGVSLEKEVELFTWEKLDRVADIRTEFKL
ncbi:MAG: methionine adenosyltransferase [Saprospirales bacterium]|nr:MAG: methionine adenosyltransferase [Saprospirales bacterium]